MNCIELHDLTCPKYQRNSHKIVFSSCATSGVHHHTSAQTCFNMFQQQGQGLHLKSDRHSNKHFLLFETFRNYVKFHQIPVNFVGTLDSKMSNNEVVNKGNAHPKEKKRTAIDYKYGPTQQQVASDEAVWMSKGCHHEPQQLRLGNSPIKNIKKVN